MRRSLQERRRTLRVWHQHLRSHGKQQNLCICEFQPNRFRKGQRRGGCGKSRCYLCHGEKLLQRPSFFQKKANFSLKEWLSEMDLLVKTN